MQQLQVAADTLTAELTRIDEPFAIVLDDYHLINNSFIHNFVTSLLKLPSGPMNLNSGVPPGSAIATCRLQGQREDDGDQGQRPAIFGH